MGESSTTTQTSSTTKYSTPTPSLTTPTTRVSGFGSTSPTSRPGSREQMDLADKFIAEYCTLDPDEVPPTPSPGCSKTTSSKSSTPNTLPATSSTDPSTGSPMKDSEPTCADSESSTTSKTHCSPPSSVLTTRSGRIKRKRSLSPGSSSKPEQRPRWGSTSLGTLKQPTTLLRVAATHHPHLLAVAYPQSSLAKDLAMGSLLLPWGNVTGPEDEEPTTSTASSATNSKTTPGAAPTNAATAATTMTTTCV